MQLFIFVLSLLPLLDGFAFKSNPSFLTRKNIIKQNAIYTSYNPLDNNDMNRKIMIIIPNNSSNGTRPGYPREANRNISYPPMNDDDLGEEIGDITKNNNSEYDKFKRYFPNAMENTFKNQDGENVNIDNNETDAEEQIRRELQDALGVRFFVRRPPHQEGGRAKRVGFQERDQEVVAPLHDRAGHARSHDRRPRRAQARSRVRQREHGGTQAR